jgi:choline dehydrogenase-like flavoprotein
MAEPLSADVVVVGSGSGGAVVARRPVDAGVRVVLVEAGGADENPAIHDPPRLSLTRCLRLISRRSRVAMRANVSRKSGWEPTSCTSVVAQPASLASTSNSISSTVLPTPRRPESTRLRS